MLLAVRLSYRSSFTLRDLIFLFSSLKGFFKSWKANFSQMLLLHRLRCSSVFFIHLFTVLCYIEWFFCVETTLHSKDITPLVMVDDPFSVLLNLVCAFINNLFIIIHFAIRAVLSSWIFRRVSLSLVFWEVFEKDWRYCFLKVRIL